MAFLLVLGRDGARRHAPVRSGPLYREDGLDRGLHHAHERGRQWPRAPRGSAAGWSCRWIAAGSSRRSSRPPRAATRGHLVQPLEVRKPLLALERIGRVLLALGVHVAARVVPPLGFLVVELGGQTPLPERPLGRCGCRRRRRAIIRGASSGPVTTRGSVRTAVSIVSTVSVPDILRSSL